MSKEKIGQYEITFIHIDGSVEGFDDATITEVSEAAIDGFGTDFATPERMRELLTPDNRLILARNPEGQLLGFFFFLHGETNTERFMYYSRAVRKEAQGQKLGHKLLSEAITTYKPTIIGARTQNPAALLSATRTLQEHGATTIYPFDGHTGEIDEDTLRALIGVGKDTSKDIDLETGIVKGAFLQGRLGDYQLFEHPELQAIEAYLAEHDFDRDAGDALLYCARLAPSLTNQPTVTRSTTAR